MADDRAAQFEQFQKQLDQRAQQRGPTADPQQDAQRAAAFDAFSKQLDARAAPSARTNTKRPHGIFGYLGDAVSDVKDAVTGLPSGLVHLGAGLAGDVNNAVEDLVFHPKRLVDFNPDSAENQKRYPTTSQFVKSYGNTAGDIAHPSRVVEAAKEGNLVPKLIEDVGNAAIVAGPAAKLIGGGAAAAATAADAAEAAAGRAAARAAAVEATGDEVATTAAREAADVAARDAAAARARATSYGTVARTAGTVAHGLDQVAAAPARVWTAPIFGFDTLNGAHVPGLIDAANRFGVPEKIAASPAGQAVQAWLQSHGWDQATREQRQTLRDRYIIPAVQERQLTGRQIELVTKQAERYLSDPEAQYAMNLVHTGQHPLVQTALDLEDPAQRDTFIRSTWGREQAPTAKTLRLADAYATGRLPQAQQEAMDAAWSSVRRMMDDHEQAMLAGNGTVNSGLNPEQTGDVPMQSKIDAALARRQQQIFDVQRELEGDPNRDVPGLRQEALTARARVPEANLADLISERARRALERRGALDMQQQLSADQAARLRASQESSLAAAEELRRLKAQTGDVAGVTAPLERGTIFAQRAGERAATAGAAADVARGRIFGEGAAAIPADGGLFDPVNAVRGMRPEDVTPEVARSALDQMDTNLRGVAARAATDARVEMGDLFAHDKLPYKETQRLATGNERRFGAGTHVDEAMQRGGEWDWFDQLPKADQDMLRKRWMEPRPADGSTGLGGVDVVSDAYNQRAGNPGAAGAHEAAMGEFVRRAKEIEALERIAKGDATAADVSLGEARLQQAADQMGVRFDPEAAAGSMVDRLAGRSGNGPKQRMAARAEQFQQFLRDRAEQDQLGPEPPSPRDGQPAAWQMPREQFVAEANSLFDQLDAAARRTSGDEWPVFTPEEQAAQRRLADLIPGEFDDPNGNLDAIHQSMVDAAYQHGYEVPAEAGQPTPATAAEARSSAGTDAVSRAEAEAQDAFEWDQQLLAARRSDPAAADLPLAYAELTPGQKAIYRELRARARQVGAEEALAEARQRVADRFAERGARAGERVGRAEGAARVFGQEANRAERAGAAAERQLGHAVERNDEGVFVVKPGVRDRATRLYEESMARPVRAGERIGRAEQTARDLERAVRSKERRLSWLQDRLDQQTAELEQGPQHVAPGKYRTPLLNAGRARGALQQMAADLAEITGDETAGQSFLDMADNLPQTMADLQASGIFPEYLVGGYDRRPGGAAATPGSREHLPFQGRVSAERMKREGTIPMSVRSTGRRALEDASRMIENRTTERIVNDGVAFTGHSYLDKLADGLPETSPERAFIDHLRERGGHDLVMEMDRQGFVPWDPTNPSGKVNERSVTADTLFMPTPLYREFRTWFKPASGHWALKLIDTPTRVIKHALLALNPGWQVGNVLGNTLMATVGGGLSPVDLFKYGRETLRLLRDEKVTGDVHFPPRLYGAGMSGEMLRYFADRPEEGGGIFGHHPIQASYNLNSFVDDWGRSTVYLAKKAQGFSDEAAVGEALKAMGDFGRMTPFEREFVKRAIPFYAWSRHITQLAWHLALEHPFRVAWTLHLADMYRPAEGDRPDFLDGALQIGPNRYITLSNLNPFGDALSSPFTSPTELARGLNPMVKAVVAAGLGVNLGKGRVFTRPPGTGPHDSYGNTQLGPLAPKELAYYLTQQTPITRALFAATQPQQVRYDTGAPMKVGGQPISDSQSRLENVLSSVGVPFVPRTVNVSEINQRAVVKAQQNERARRRYFGG